MGKINVLGFDVANLIAAGEVVDRPASIVKELLENAVDSGANTITVEIKNGGISHIRVSDNGCGIDSDDLPLAVLRHATSKIKSARDLETIGTLGFRGEALAAIAAVTKLQIFSKPKSEKNGSFLLCEGGEIVDLREAGCSDGTTVIANELFYNVPARRKFLKRDATEGAKISEIVEKVAMSVPDISIKYIYDGQMRFMTPGDGNLKNAIYAIYGKRCASRLIDVDRSENGVKVYGFVSDSDMTFSKRSEEIFFVNGRYIKSPLLTASLERAYISKIPQDKFPMCVLMLRLESRAVDVNVHPTKMEVKFSNERIVSEAVHYAVLTALNRSNSRPELNIGEIYGQTAPAPSTKSGEFFVSGETAAKILNAFVPVEKEKSQRNVQAQIPTVAENDNRCSTPKNNDSCIKQDSSANAKEAEAFADKDKPRASSLSSIMAGYDLPDFVKSSNAFAEKANVENSRLSSLKTTANAEIGNASKTDVLQNATQKFEKAVAEKAETPVPSAQIPKYTIIGEAYNCYVIVELDDRVLFIDKHAAHERILFDSLCERRRNKGREAQLLIAPISLSLLEDEFLCLTEYADDIRSVGFDFKVSDGRTIEITQVPVEIDSSSAADMIKTMLARLIEGVGTVESTESEFFERALFQAACKAAIKGGRYYGIDHIKWLCSKLLKDPGDDGKVIKTCPHGRPVAFEIKKSSIERQFARLE